LYSSSFNPIFNSLNNKYLTSPGLLGKGTAQIKILKNNSTWPNSNDSLNPTDRMISAHPQASKGGKSTITKTLPTLDSPISTRECVAGKSDNKKYLFLYFILPIFFSTLKNSTAAIQPSLPKGRVVPCSGKYNHALIKSNLLVERMHKKLNNQIKQLRLLIKLMLNSDSALLRSRQWIRRHSGLQLPYGLTTLQPSLKNNIINKADQEQKKEWENEIKRSTKLPTVLTQTTLTNIIENFALASDLLKWSVLLIAESLAPLTPLLT